MGYFLLTLTKVGAFLVGVWGGYSLALLLYNAILYKIHSQGFFWGWTIVVALICGSLVICLYDHILILSTSLAGSYLLV